MIKLYHGSNTIVHRIDLSLSKKGKDFGRGFYLNPNKEQAKAMAERTVRRMMSGSPIVNSFWFDDTWLTETAELKVRIFDDYSVEWAEFILMNRKNQSDTPVHAYDIVVGPIANDTVGLQLHRFLQGYISIERMIEELHFPGNKALQYFFGTEKAISLLKRAEDEDE